MPEIDLTLGGYGGDIVEEMFKPFTAYYMDYWWQFREVLWPCQQKGETHWRRIDGNPLTDGDWTQLIALSMTNYAVYVGIAEAVAFYEQMIAELTRTTFDGWRIFEVRRPWKAMYSSLYSSLTALSNIVCMVVGNKPIFRNPEQPRNYDPRNAIEVAKLNTVISNSLNNCVERMEIRNQLDHYWLIWHNITQGRFFIDSNFKKKGHIVLDPTKDAKVDLDARDKALDDLLSCATNFNNIYKVLAIRGGYLDNYLEQNGWRVEYSDYGKPHNGKRPLP